jgi:hypothetical protein
MSILFLAGVYWSIAGIYHPLLSKCVMFTAYIKANDLTLLNKCPVTACQKLVLCSKLSTPQYFFVVISLTTTMKTNNL